MSNRFAILTMTFANCHVVEELDLQEHSGDEFACLEEHDCVNPGGHLFLTSCGETKYMHCGTISWS